VGQASLPAGHRGDGITSVEPENAAVSEILDVLARGGDKAMAARDLLPLVYAELRRLAARKLNRAAPGETLQPTSLVHEAYLRLVHGGDGCSSSPAPPPNQARAELT
jgi:hypothetical protein